MRVHAFAAAIAALLLSGCDGAGNPASRQPAHGAPQEKQADAVWEYEAEVDKMTDRTVHYLLAEGKGDTGESYGLALKCDGGLQFLLDPAGAANDVEWEAFVDPGLPARHISARFGSQLIPGLLTEAEEEGFRITLQSPDAQHASLLVLLAASEAVKKLGVDRIDTRQVAEAAGPAFAGLAGILGSDKFLLSGVHAGEVIEFPAPKGDPNAARFFSACRETTYKTFGIALPQDQTPSGRTVAEAGIGAGPAPVVDAATEPDAATESVVPNAASGSRFTMRVAADSLTPSESGDGFSFKLADGREFYVTANEDVSTPGADLLAQAERDGGIVCITELDGQVTKVDAGACP